MITAFIRIEGRPLGLIANNPMVLGGAIDADAAEFTGLSCMSAAMCAVCCSSDTACLTEGGPERSRMGANHLSVFLAYSSPPYSTVSLSVALWSFGHDLGISDKINRLSLYFRLLILSRSWTPSI
jgi:hypothetical protein